MGQEDSKLDFSFPTKVFSYCMRPDSKRVTLASTKQQLGYDNTKWVKTISCNNTKVRGEFNEVNGIPDKKWTHRFDSISGHCIHKQGRNCIAT